jgi:LDH2 family malate/lactate/ureidoglycolate dehydrogenase
MSVVTVQADALRAFCAQVYRALGVRDGAADLLADTLVQADLWGHSSHGVMRLFWYAARMRSGATKLEAEPLVVTDAGALQQIEGGDGIGHVMAKAAMVRAIASAQSFGIGAVSVRNSGHFGTAMYYTRMAAQAGCIGFLSTNASPSMAPWGGREKLMGNNPFSWAAPAGRYPPMMLDIALTAVARGKLYLARQRGEEIPLGWAMNAEGADTTDPVAGIAGTILPMAGHKGFAITTLMDVLSGVLSGSAFADGVTGPYMPEGRSGVGHLAIAIDIDKLRPLSAFEADMEVLIEKLHAAPAREGTRICYPGQPEAEMEIRLLEQGIPIPIATADDLRTQARELGIDAPF